MPVRNRPHLVLPEMKPLSEHCREGGDRVALLDMRTGATTSYAELANLLLRGGAFLRSCGVARGDRVVQRLPNSPEALCMFLTCLESGIDCAPLSLRATAEEADDWMRLTEAKLAIISRTQFDAATDALSASGRCMRIDTSGDFSWLPDIAEATEAEQPGRLLIRAGGRGDETKIVILPSNTLRDCARAFAAAYPAFQPGANCLNVAPPSTLYGLFNLGLLPIEMGASITIGGEFSTQVPSKFWHDVARFETDLIWLAPTMVRVLLDDYSRAQPAARRAMVEDALGVKAAFVGMAPCSAAEKDEFTRIFGVPVHENYGLTETLFVSASSPSRADNIGTGIPLQGVEVQLRETAAVPLIPSSRSGPEAATEILVKSPYLFAGYLRPGGKVDPPEFDAAGFFHTGDLGRFESNGTLVVDGRLKAMIKRAGHPVFLSEVESLMHLAAAVGRAAAVPVPHAFFGEGYILMVEPADPTIDDRRLLEEVRQVLTKQLGREKWPEQIRVVRDMPLTERGMPDYSKLKTAASPAP